MSEEVTFDARHICYIDADIDISSIKSAYKNEVQKHCKSLHDKENSVLCRFFKDKAVVETVFKYDGDGYDMTSLFYKEKDVHFESDDRTSWLIFAIVAGVICTVMFFMIHFFMGILAFFFSVAVVFFNAVATVSPDFDMLEVRDSMDEIVDEMKIACRIMEKEQDEKRYDSKNRIKCGYCGTINSFDFYTKGTALKCESCGANVGND